MIHGIDKEFWKEKELAIERFRPNVVVNGEGMIPYEEELWEEVEAGNPETGDSCNILLVSRCYRCSVSSRSFATALAGSSTDSCC